MKDYIDILEKLPLFEHIDSSEIESMLKCLKASVKAYGKGSYIAMEGDKADFIGIILSGTVQILTDDFKGRRNLTASLAAGDMFAEAFACAQVPALPVDILSCTDTTIMFLGIDQILNQCTAACQFHGQLIRNLLRTTARKNMALTSKLGYISHKTTAEKIMAYLNDQAKRHHSLEFDIPYDRQSLADFLGVERSAMSAEISKLQKKGLIQTRKNHFKLL